MKHVWGGTALLAVLLCAGLLLNAAMVRTHGALSPALTRAAEASLAGNWTEADALTGTVRSRWEKHRQVTASVTDHALLEEVDCLLSELAVYRAEDLAAEYAAVCMCLASRIEAVVENQGLQWWHLL